MNERDWLVAGLWCHSTAHEKISLEMWSLALHDWEITPIIVNGMTVGATMVKGPEIHLASWMRPKASTRACAKAILRAVVDREGYATTKVLADNPAGLAFCRRLGFLVDIQEDGVIYLTCKEPRHA